MIERYGIGRAAAALAAIALALGQLACGPSAPAPAGALDVRGSWEMVAIADGSQYPQTLRIQSEDLTTGKFSGSDVGGGATFLVTGSLSGAAATFLTTGGGYTSNATARISGSGLNATMAGTFTDSNHRSGTFTARRTSL